MTGEETFVAEQSVNWLAFQSDDPDVQPGRMRLFDGGFGAIYTGTGVYMEQHTVKVKAFDRSGNEVESNEIKFYVKRASSN